ncbi:MAG: Plug domain-containing protein, partial [Gammaproteobacteria bacterium]|nr:Plug domain-containing protein [Gammaproteobacteria bacterium]
MNQKSYQRHKPSGQNFQKTRIAEAVSAAVVAMVMTAPVMAVDDADTSSDGKLIVTATKNAESIQDAPLAITSLTGEFIDEVHLVDVKDLVRFSPGVNGNNNNSFLDSVSVRGVRTDDYGAGSDGSLGFFKNDLFEGRTGSASSTLFDMDRAEIINGPQGFLFGRNAIGGAVSVHTRKAEIDVDEASVDLDIGEYGLVKINGMINIPINDNFAMRFAGVYHNEESYIKNVNPDNPLQDTDVKSARWSTTYNNNDDLVVQTMVEYEDWKYPAGQYRN